MEKRYDIPEEKKEMASEPAAYRTYGGTARPVFTSYQMQILEIISRVKSEKEMADIKQLLAQYFADKAEDAIDKLWEEGIINDSVIEDWKNEHMRTPYKQS